MCYKAFYLKNYYFASTLVEAPEMENRVIGFIDNFGKINAIVIRDDQIELQETKLKRSDCSNE